MQEYSPEQLQSGIPAHVYLRPAEAARYLGLSESTLAKLRMRHRRSDGPKFAKMNGCVVYRQMDLDAWIESCFVAADASKVEGERHV
ncbi:helix-turn-helix transcriptional regulator [Ruegeria aquimaris]|nr:helix-turn-helix domain-containing protein [Ruegeria sp. XHP0148]